MFLAPFLWCIYFASYSNVRACSNVDNLLENLILLINSKRVSNIIKKLDITWISCDGLYAWL